MEKILIEIKDGKVMGLRGTLDFDVVMLDHNYIQRCCRWEEVKRIYDKITIKGMNVEIMDRYLGSLRQDSFDQVNQVQFKNNLKLGYLEDVTCKSCSKPYLSHYQQSRCPECLTLNIIKVKVKK